jgi:hypothetical protein
MTYWRSTTVNGLRVVAGGHYRHKKTNGIYRVGCIARMEADLTPVVVYARDAEVWVRPLSGSRPWWWCSSAVAKPLVSALLVAR